MRRIRYEGVRVEAMRIVIAIFCAMAGIGGCQAAYFLTDPDKAKSVKAEYGKLDGRTGAVLVWADQATLDVDPKARFRIGKAATYYLRQDVPGAEFVSAEDVNKLQTSGEDWQGLSNAQVCKRLKCDVLIRVDLLEYTTRATDTTELRKGRIRATVNVFERNSGGVQDAKYSTEVLTTYPPGSVHGTTDLDEADLMRETIELFAQEMSRKFHDHQMRIDDEKKW